MEDLSCEVYELSEDEKEHYRFGACYLLALALHLELDYDLYFFWETLPNMDQLDEKNPECLIHAFAVSPEGRKFDVKGETNDEKIGSVYADVDYPRARKETKETVDKLIWSGILALWSYYIGEVDELRKCIKKNVKHYM